MKIWQLLPTIAPSYDSQLTCSTATQTYNMETLPSSAGAGTGYGQQADQEIKTNNFQHLSHNKIFNI